MKKEKLDIIGGKGEINELPFFEEKESNSNFIFTFIFKFIMFFLTAGVIACGLSKLNNTSFFIVIAITITIIIFVLLLKFIKEFI